MEPITPPPRRNPPRRRGGGWGWLLALVVILVVIWVVWAWWGGTTNVREPAEVSRLLERSVAGAPGPTRVEAGLGLSRGA